MRQSESTDFPLHPFSRFSVEIKTPRYLYKRYKSYKVLTPKSAAVSAEDGWLIIYIFISFPLEARVSLLDYRRLVLLSGLSPRIRSLSHVAVKL